MQPKCIIQRHQCTCSIIGKLFAPPLSDFYINVVSSQGNISFEDDKTKTDSINCDSTVSLIGHECTREESYHTYSKQRTDIVFYLQAV